MSADVPSPIAPSQAGAGSFAGPDRRGGASSPLLSPLALDCGARGAGVVGGRFSPGLPVRSASAPAESRRFSCAPGGRSHAPRGVRGHDPGVHVQEDLGARARVRARGGALSGVLSRAQEEPGRVEGLSRRSPGECRTSVREVQDGRASHGEVAAAAGRLADVDRRRGRLPTRADPP